MKSGQEVWSSPFLPGLVQPSTCPPCSNLPASHQGAVPTSRWTMQTRATEPSAQRPVPSVHRCHNVEIPEMQATEPRPDPLPVASVFLEDPTARCWAGLGSGSQSLPGSVRSPCPQRSSERNSQSPCPASRTALVDSRGARCSYPRPGCCPASVYPPTCMASSASLSCCLSGRSAEWLTSSWKGGRAAEGHHSGLRPWRGPAGLGCAQSRALSSHPARWALGSGPHSGQAPSSARRLCGEGTAR